MVPAGLEIIEPMTILPATGALTVSVLPEMAPENVAEPVTKVAVVIAVREATVCEVLTVKVVGDNIAVMTVPAVTPVPETLEPTAIVPTTIGALTTVKVVNAMVPEKEAPTVA